MTRDAIAAERRQRLRALQAPREPEPYDYAEAARFAGYVLLWAAGCIAGGVVFAWALGSGLDLLERWLA